MNTDFDPRQIFPDLYGPLSVGGLPNINITSHVAIGDYGGFPPGKQFTNQYIDNFTYVRGSHTIKAGIDFANYRVSTPPGTFGLATGLAQNAGLGRFDFNGRFTNNDGRGAASTPSRISCSAIRSPLFAPRRARSASSIRPATAPTPRTTGRSRSG